MKTRSKCLAVALHKLINGIQHGARDEILVELLGIPGGLVLGRPGQVEIGDVEVAQAHRVDPLTKILPILLRGKLRHGQLR